MAHASNEEMAEGSNQEQVHLFAMEYQTQLLLESFWLNSLLATAIRWQALQVLVNAQCFN